MSRASTLAKAVGSNGDIAVSGSTTLGDAVGDILTINAGTVSTPNGLNFDSNTLVIDHTNNRIGIGTATPTSTLDVLGAIRSRGSVTPTFSLNDGTIENYLRITSSQLQLVVPSANPITFLTTNAERMRIDATGNMLIGTTSQAPLAAASGKYATIYNNSNATLSIQSVDAGNDRSATLELLSSGNGGSFSQIVYGDTDTTPGTPSPLIFAGYHSGTRTERMRIDASGNVGIGATSPIGKLDINATTDGQVMAQVRNLSAGTSAYSAFFLGNDTNATAAYIGLNSSTNTARGGGANSFNIITGLNAPLVLGIGGTERARITSDGNLNVGTVTNTTFRISSAGHLSFTNATSNTDNTSDAYRNGIGWASTNQPTGVLSALITAENSAGYGANVLFLIRGTGGGSLVERMRIDSSGNVLVGTTTANNIKFVVDSGASNYSTAFIKNSGAIPDNNDNSALYVLHAGTTGTGFRLRTDQALTGSNFAHILVNNSSASINGLQVSQYGTGYIASFDKSGLVAMRIDTSGRVGINVTPSTSTDAKLQVTGGTTNVTTLATAYSTASLVVVPKSSSGYSLAIASGTNDSPQLQVTANGAATGDLLIQPYGGNTFIGLSQGSVFDAVGATRALVVSRADTNTSNIGSLAAIVISNSDATTNNVSQINFAATSGTGANIYSSGIISVIHGPRTASQYHTGIMCFSTSNSVNAAPSEKMRIDSSGNVCIGTTTASGKVHIAGSLTISTAATIAGNDAILNIGSNNRTVSTSTTTGAIICGGGMGVWGTVNAGGQGNFADSVSVFSTNPSSTQQGVLLRNVYNVGPSIFSMGAATTNGLITWVGGNGAQGAINGNGAGISYTSNSDYRLKENVTPMTGALAKIATLKPVTYKWKFDGSAGDGFLAHELAEVCPWAVHGEKDGVDKDGNPEYQSVDTSFLIGTLTAAIQELKAIVDAQAVEIAALKVNS